MSEISETNAPARKPLKLSFYLSDDADIRLYEGAVSAIRGRAGFRVKTSEALRQLTRIGAQHVCQQQRGKSK